MRLVAGRRRCAARRLRVERKRAARADLTRRHRRGHEIDAAVEEAATAGHVVVPATIDLCELIAVWALPHPDRVIVGFEEHPQIDCVRAVVYTAIFVIPDSGENSQGAWTYSAVPDVESVRQAG